MKKGKKLSDRKIILWVLGIFCILLIGATVYTVLMSRRASEEVQGEAQDTQDQFVTYNGKKYEKNPDIRMILFLGIDKESTADLGGNPGTNGQSDSINLLVLNTKEKTGQFLQISRDMIVPIDVYDVQGEKILTEEGQLALQYAYGDGKEKSCRLTKEKVEDLLYGISIPDYFALTIDGISVAADAVGGIPVTVPKDYTYLDPAFQEGARITLNGTLAETYVRGRDTGELDSNVDRMERQSQVMQSLLSQLKTEEVQESYASIYQKMQPYLVTNMSFERLESLAEYEISDEILTLPGEVQEEDGKAAFYPEEIKTREFILKLVYKEIES